VLHCCYYFSSGAEFDRLSPEQQVAASKSLAVFARVEPLHKLRLVELLRAQVSTRDNLLL
jgi:magnesium-transporting ATPase (P-type)